MKNLRYANINSKLKGMHAKFLSRDDLEQLSKQNDFKNAVYFLKNELEVLKNIGENADRRTIERELDKTIIEDIEKIKKVLSNKDKEFFELFISKYEIKCIIEILKMIEYNKDLSDSKNIVSLWTSTVFKNIKGIENCKNIEQYLEILKKSKYYNVVKLYLNENNKNFADLDTKLNKIYFKNLYDEAKKINKKVVFFVGENIDLLNISWIYRIKKYYKMSENRIREKIINVNFKIDEKVTKQMIDSEDIDILMQIIKSTKYAKKVEKLSDETLENDINRYLFKKYKKDFVIGDYSIVTVVSYMMLKEFQKQNIINILGGISYNLDKKDIANKIIT